MEEKINFYNRNFTFNEFILSYTILIVIVGYYMVSQEYNQSATTAASIVLTGTLVPTLLILLVIKFLAYQKRKTLIITKDKIYLEKNLNKLYIKRSSIKKITFLINHPNAPKLFKWYSMTRIWESFDIRINYVLIELNNESKNILYSKKNIDVRLFLKKLLSKGYEDLIEKQY